MGINLALGLAHSLKAAEVVGFPERVLSSVEMRRAAEQLWHVMSPRWSNLDPVNEFTTFLPSERLPVSDIETGWKQGQLLPSFQWAGFHLYFGEAAVAANHLEKLAGFALDLDGLRNPLLMCAQALARELQSPKIVYGPDSSSPFEEVLSVVGGRSLAEVLSDAKRRCGVAAATIREMADETEKVNLHGKCYYVEDVDLQEQ